MIRLKIKNIYNKKLNKRDEAKSTINNYRTSNLITLMNLFVFTKRERLINEILLIIINNFSIFALSRNKRKRIKK